MFKIKIKTPERRQWHHSSVFIINIEYISQLDLVFLLLILRRKIAGSEYFIFL